MHVQTWWAMFGLRDRHGWDFGGFAILLVQVIMLYLLAGLIYPEFAPDRQVDLHAHYFEQRRHFFSFCIVLLLVIVITNVPLRGMWSVVVIILVILLSIIFALAGWWEIILTRGKLLAVHINMGAYLFLSLALFVLWLVNFTFFDRQRYLCDYS